MRTKKTNKIYRTGIKGLLINNDLRFVANNISQLTQNFRLANKIKVLPVFERYQLPIKKTLSMPTGMLCIFNIKE